MAAISEVDFALATFWEFVKMWRTKASSKLLLSCEGRRAHVELVATLGEPDDQHVPEPPQFLLGRLKSPAQLRRSERRRQEFLKKKKEAFDKDTSGALETEKKEVDTKRDNPNAGLNQPLSFEFVDTFWPDETCDAKKSTEIVDAEENVTIAVEGEFHGSFPFKKFNEYLEAALADTLDKSEKYGYWFDDKCTRFFAKLRLKSGITKEAVLTSSSWPKEIENVKVSEGYTNV